MTGCAGGPQEQKEDDFFTSGSREADQRASQRIARDEQLEGTGQGSGAKEPEKGSDSKTEAEAKRTLFERLGGTDGIAAIIDDFVPRILEDPRVNWERKGIKSGGLFRRERSVTWTATPANVRTLKEHMVQFLSLATGGPAQYDGKEMVATHADMEITNAEFDAVIGDLKATLDRLRVPTQEQKELLAIVESTRPQVVTQR